MSISKKLAVAIAFTGLLASSAAFAQGPGAPSDDLPVDLDGIGVSALPPPPPPFMEGDVMFEAPMEGEMGPSPEMLAAGPPGAPPGFAAPGGGFRGHGSPFANLNLTDEQYERLFAVKRDSAGKGAAKMGEMMAAHMALQDLMLQPELDRARILAAQARINALKADIANARLDDRINMMNVLTAEQRKELRRNMLQHMGGMGCGRGGRGGGRGGGPGGGPGGGRGGGPGGGPGGCPMTN